MAFTACLAAPPAAPEGQLAAYVPHAINVKLQGLPKRYTCDELWYKFRDVLASLGARGDVDILTYGCKAALGDAGRSPSVELKFSVPEVLHGAQTQWADVRVVKSTAQLRPGQPRSLDAADCELIRQMEAKLIPALPVRVTHEQLDCSGPNATATPFALSIDVLVPEQAPPAAVPTRETR
jgi:hypothetical protein